jgi:hypothetical protein
MAVLAAGPAARYRRCDCSTVTTRPIGSWVSHGKRNSRQKQVINLEDKQQYVYCFHLWPDETWGRKDMDDEHPNIPAAVFDLFRMINNGIEMRFTALEFVRFRHDVESFGITLREISRVPYHEEETVL